MKLIIDHETLLKRRIRAEKASVKGADFLLKYVNQELDERLSVIERKFKTAIQLHGYTGDLADRIRQRGQADHFQLIDWFQQNHDDATLVTSLEKFPDLSSKADLIVSPLSLHLTNDTPGMFMQINKALSPDGLFSGAVLGAGTLQELRECLLVAETELFGGASARVLPFADIRDFGGLLQRAGFTLPVIDSEGLTVRYDSLFALMKDLRAMGMTNSLTDRSKKPTSRTLFKRANEIYLERFSDHDGRIRASFNIIYLNGWKAHDSQQKPLKPGSAKQRLADALNVDEIKVQK
ncbi:class I SAM-dependent methyltransferase [Lentilitoribacter sp. Alg239-R112]|uniref:class I SAM-dependent methyltransferase n=1 Tax=Lentilitoribacter sp. Alg239-R112 TaxID=2305987 RepID=UPI0013A68B96|nr:class I SAM-dependent methyltransferase [Lentilitoribacter sp. Alg239-R112]